MSEQDRTLFIEGRLLRRDPNRPGLGLGQILLRAYGKALKAELVCEPQKDQDGLAVGLRLPLNHRREGSYGINSERGSIHSCCP